MKIRPVQPADRDRLLEILIATKRFTDQEVGWAIELVDKAIAEPERGEYVVQVLEDERMIAGYVCFGPTPMTDSVYDLYWIAVDPERQGQGLGRQLLRFVENEVTSRNGRMLLIETSSKESYAPTLRFYQRSGYDEISRIKDFYRVEHDKIVFSKKLTS
jgi:ribosomal protein S18 acetylase RimI-like enzyme